jgi:hypothetical protein
MDISSLRRREPGNTPRARARRRRRWLEAFGLVIGLAAVVTLVLTPGPFGGLGLGPGASHPADTGHGVVKQSAVGPIPTALDAEWAAYSGQSTCADWAGGDGVSAVRLSASQIAWFFSDSYLGPASPSSGFSRSAGLVHNSVVVQTSSGSGSRFATLTGGGLCSSTAAPAAVVSPPHVPGTHGEQRYWDEDGIEVGGTVVKFYNRYLPGNAPYIPTGTVMAAFPASQLSAAGRGPARGGVARPRVIPLPSWVPPDGGSPVVWGASILRTGNTIYVYGTQTPDDPFPYRRLYVARVPASRLTQFAAWQFYAGYGLWTAHQRDAAVLQTWGSPLSVSSGFSVIAAGQRYWLIQADPVAGSQDIDAYPGGAPWGPFDQAAGIVLYRDPGIGVNAAHDFRIMYEARVIPAVSTSQALVIAYNVNSIGNTAGCIPMSWFTDTVTLPRFISVPMTMFTAAFTAASGSAGRGSGDVTVLTGPSDYPRVAARDPSQWFDEWDYPDGCPPVPGVRSVKARPRAGAVTLSWPDAGLGVAYRIYVRPPGAASYALTSTVRFVMSTTARTISVTLSGLAPGKYQARVVPINLRLHTGHVAHVAFTVPGG